MSLRLAYGGAATRVCCPSDAVRDWLVEFMCPPFQRDHRPASAEIEASFDAGRFEDALRGGRPGREVDCFTLDQGHARFPLWIDGPDRALAFDPRWRIFVGLRRGAARLELLAEADHRYARLGLMRLLREVATAHSLAAGLIHIHGAAVECRGRVVLLAGPKGSGKSSFLLYALGQEGTRYLSNDRVFVELEAAVPMALGMPTIVRLRPGTLALFPEVARRLNALGWQSHQSIADAAPERDARERTDAAASLSPPQLRSLLGAEAASGGEIGGIVFPEIGAPAAGFDLRRLTAAEAAARLARDGLIAGGTAADFLAEAWPAARRAPALLDERLADLGRRVPCFAMTLGPSAYGSAAAWAAVLEATAVR